MHRRRIGPTQIAMRLNALAAVATATTMLSTHAHNTSTSSGVCTDACQPTLNASIVRHHDSYLSNLSTPLFYQLETQPLHLKSDRFGSAAQVNVEPGIRVTTAGVTTGTWPAACHIVDPDETALPTRAYIPPLPLGPDAAHSARNYECVHL